MRDAQPLAKLIESFRQRMSDDSIARDVIAQIFYVAASTRARGFAFCEGQYLGAFDMLPPTVTGRVLADLALAFALRERQPSESDHALYELCRLEAQSLATEFPCPLPSRRSMREADIDAALLFAAIGVMAEVPEPIQRIVFGRPLCALQRHPAVVAAGGMRDSMADPSPNESWAHARQVIGRFAPATLIAADGLGRGQN